MERHTRTLSMRRSLRSSVSPSSYLSSRLRSSRSPILKINQYTYRLSLIRPTIKQSHALSSIAYEARLLLLSPLYPVIAYLLKLFSISSSHSAFVVSSLAFVCFHSFAVPSLPRRCGAATRLAPRFRRFFFPFLVLGIIVGSLGL